MRYLILSDIHSNQEALEACVQRGKQAGYDAVLCCGDIVGYGPSPVEAIDGIRALNSITIRGNHDRVAAGLDEATQFNPHARHAVYWTRAVLPDSYREYLANLPVGPLQITAESQLVHGALTDEDDYIFTEADADENFPLANKSLTFFGHSHFPIVFCSEKKGAAFQAMNVEVDEYIMVKCEAGKRMLVNPGSVGQPRDGDARASFAIWDADKFRIEFYRVDYDVKLTQEKMRAAGLSNYLVDRLAHGR